MVNELDYIPQGSVYKYTSLEGAMATLKNQSLRFTCPLDFNDPFDCNKALLTFSKNDASIKEYAEALKLARLPRKERRKRLIEFDNPLHFQNIYNYVIDQKIKNSKVSCFSETYSNTLMWSHYANNHKGICLEFNGSMNPDEILEKRECTFLRVNYESDNKIFVNYNDDKRIAVAGLFTRKSIDWKYEQEVRLIVIDADKDHRFNKAFLTGVIMGCRTSEQEAKLLVEMVKINNYDISVRRAIKGTFKLNFETTHP